MIKICVVGEIGSGKTSLSKLFSPKKNLIFNADIEVNKIYKLINYKCDNSTNYNIFIFYCS